MKILFIIIAWIIAIILLLIGFKLGRESTIKISVSNPDEISERDIDKDMDLLKDIICKICDYAVDNKLPPTLTVETVAKNILAICSLADFDGWQK